jgi:long-subunit acyl-CoA synthetase (AMP-forming)
MVEVSGESPATVCAAFQATARRGGDAVALRSSDGEVEVTWREYADRVRSLAAGLAGLGVGRGDTVGLLLANRPEFNLVDTAAIHLGATPFSIYPTLPGEEIAYLLTNARCRVIVTEGGFVERLDTAIAQLGHSVTLVTIDGAVPGAVTLDEVETGGDADFDFAAAWQAVQPSDVLTLIYTSGTTGRPKGVEITHDNMVHQVRLVASRLPIEAGDTITSYLPSAHIADRWSSHYNSLVLGVGVTTVADGRTIAQVLPGLRPTLWGGVPRVMEKLTAGLEAAIDADPDEDRRAATRRAIEVGIQRVRAEQEHRELSAEMAEEHARVEEAVLAPLRRRIGLDRAKWIVVGAAPLSRRVHELLLGLGLPVVELYGMSEASCVISVSPPAEVHVGAVGEPIPEVEVMRADDGELLVRGPTVMRGYRDEPEKTAEAVDADGWLHTGDVVTIGDDRQIRIVDRKKELIINAAGKNMSPANIELELKAADSLIGQAVVIGDGRPYNVALLVLDPDLAGSYARGHGLGDTSLASVAADPDVANLVDEAVERANHRLSRVEQIKRYRLLGEEWLPGGDELTPTMKIRRKVIDRKYAATIDALYGR